MPDKKIIFLLALISIGLVLSSFGAWDSINEQWIDAHIRNQGFSGVLTFVGFCALFTACGLPRQVAAFLGGYAFGFVTGTILATLAASFGCIISFYVAKVVARPIIRKKYPEKIKAIHGFLNHQTFNKTIIIRLLPAGSNLITNLVAGVARINVKPFVIGSFIGYLPQMIVFSLAGSGIEVMSVWKLAISIGLFVISSILSGYLYRDYKKNHKKNDPLLL
jgi:uncharacterized membrane protein YdjX (TVP38/TMEM64 family)